MHFRSEDDGAAGRPGEGDESVMEELAEQRATFPTWSDIYTTWAQNYDHLEEFAKITREPRNQK
jgi:hypothetical protein